MPTIFERARDRREKEGEAALGESAKHEQAEKAAAKPTIDFFRPLPKDPEAEAAKKRALIKLLRDRG